MAHEKSKNCPDGEHCPHNFVTDELCLSRRETVNEMINGLKKQIWASVATVGAIAAAIGLIDIILRLAGR
jgi:hypothetical protein